MHQPIGRKILYFIPALIGAGMFFSCENDIEEVARIAGMKDAPQESFITVQLIYKDSGRTKAILESPLVNRYYGEKERMEFPNGLKVDFYTAEGIKESQLTSKFGLFNQKNQELEVRNNVVFINFIRRDTLFTEQLTWSQQNPDSTKIHTDKMVLVKTPNSILKSKGLFANQTFSYYEFINFQGSYFYNSEE